MRVREHLIRLIPSHRTRDICLRSPGRDLFLRFGRNKEKHKGTGKNGRGETDRDSPVTLYLTFKHILTSVRGKELRQAKVMTRQVVLMLSLALLLLVCCCCGEARVRLNSIRTVILREGHSLPMNRSTWEPSLDLTLYQCMSDLECREGSYCHAPTKGPAHSRCQTCRRRKRRCHRDGMCCPGNRCSNNICVPDVDSFVSQRIPDGGMGLLAKKKGWRKRSRMNVNGPPSKGQVGDPCLRSSDCSDGFCCARHFWTRICKPVLQEGQVCTRHRRKGNHGLELFQRCPCGDGLSCRTLRDPNAQPSSPSSSSSSSLLRAEAAKSKFAASSSSSRHSSPHTSLLSSSSKSSSSSAVAKTRLHVCQKN